MIAGDLARCLDPVLLAADAGYPALDDWQARLLRERPRRSLLCCSRQSGKSTVTALIALYVALYEAPALVLLVSPAQRQSAELFRVFMTAYQKLQGTPPLVQESVLRCEFANGSRVIALPSSEKTLRGFAKVDLCVIDEAARVQDELLGALRPMMAVSRAGGRLIALSTPAGRRGWFFEAWTSGGETWDRTRVAAEDCPRISKEFLAEELKELGALRFSEEYALEFIDDDSAVFPSEIIAAAFTDAVVPLWQ
jgi:Terminase large subunit, T4likevirus-type, N-terminal